MLRLCELTGLTVADMGEITGFFIAGVTVGVFIAIILSWTLKIVFELAAELIDFIAGCICKYIRKKKHR